MYGHSRAGNNLGNYQGRPLIVGGNNWYPGYYHDHTELLDLENEKWRGQQAYPFHRSIFYSTSVSYSDQVVLFGGYTDENDANGNMIGPVNTVAAFTAGSWVKLGELKDKRHLHNGVYYDDGRVVLVGGLGIHPTEIWDTTENNSTSTGPKLEDYRYYPTLFKVNFDFNCNK